MKNDTRPQNARGIAEVNDIVQARMKMGWQEISQINDNGIDGIIIDRKKGIDTGTNYYVQVKCGDSYYYETFNRPKHFGVKVGEEYILSHRERWNKIQGPVILVYVDFETRKSWWTNLKSKNSYCPELNKQIILVPKNQRFGEHSVGALRKLRGYYDLDRKLDVIKLEKSDLIVNSISKSIKQSAKEYYRHWALMPEVERTNPALGEINISRVGWRHITERGRGLDNMLQSWQLLGVAKKIIQCNEKPFQIRKPDLSKVGDLRVLHDYLSLRSRVIFPNRQESVVQVIIKRLRRINEYSGSFDYTNWFYSVHEPRKGKKMH
ncbi:DUF4365 domain-containing protein [Phaeodactylibacter xiamenensis]|uniref:DUF4365 domain-containing protein n=1 Tax=Phaeodactylibacter xiamenensis TaxID=1524460 RepID=UPI003CCC3804